MKQFFTYFLFTFFIVSGLQAQDSTFVCEPDSAFLASGEIIFPTPYLNDTIGDGIPVEACINTPYQLTFFVNAPGMLITPSLPFPVTLESITIDSVQNLPEGITYSCSNGDCVVVPDTVNCIQLSGTPTDNNQPGEYELKIFLTAQVVGLGALPIAYPDPSVAPGTYILTLKEEGSADCGTTPVFDYQKVPAAINLYPNPVASAVTLEWDSKKVGEGVLQVMSYTGQLLYERNISFGQGLERQDLQVDHLQPGMYLIGIQAPDTHFWTKMIKE